MAAAACSRGNLQLLFVDKKTLTRLAGLEALLAAAAAAGEEQPPAPPSVLRGCIVRLKYAGTYHLLPVEQLFAAADGKHGLAVASPDAQQQGALLRVQLSSASGTNPLADEQWEAAGRAEAERLAALLQRRVQPLSVAEVAAAAWRKQAALAWHALHGAQPPAEQQRHLPALLEQLADEQAIAELQQQVEPEQQQREQPASFTVQLQRPALVTYAPPPGQAQADGAQPQPPQRQPSLQREQQEQQQQQQQQHAVNAAAAPPPNGTIAAPPAAAAADFLAGLEQQLVDATARSAANGSSDATTAVVADIQQQLLALKQQLLAQQQQQLVAAVQPAWHASSSSGDHLSPYTAHAMHGGQLHPSPPLPTWQLQQQAGLHPGPLHQPLPAATSPRQVWHGESASPPRLHTNAGSLGLGGRPGRLPSRSPSPRRGEWRGPPGEPPLVPAAVCHFKFGNRVRWELVGREIFVSGLPTCDGEQVERRVVAHRLAKLTEGLGAAVEEVKINSGDARGDVAFVTLATARQAARAIEMLQGAELMGRQLFLRPFRNEVDTLKRRFPEAAAEAARALEDLAVQGPPWGPGPPPSMRGPPPPHMRGGSPPPFRGRSPPPHRSRSPPPLRGRSPQPLLDRGRKRGRSGDRSQSPGRGGRRAARSVSPDVILAPVLVNHFLQRGGQQEWLLTGREVEISGLRDSRDEAAMWHQIMPLVAAAGGTVTDRQVVGGSDSRGPLIHLTLATAQQAAAVIECLQAVEVEGGQLYLRPVRQEVEDKSCRHPEAAAAAKRALEAAAGRAGRSSPPRGGSPGGSRRDRGGAPHRERSPPRRRSPGRAEQLASKGGSRGGGSTAAKPSSGSGGSMFWDPVYRLERRCLSLLQSQGCTTVSWLFGELGAVPPPCGPLNTTLLRRFLDRRPHLFCLDREEVEAAEGAAAVLRYKRELLQYLGSRAPQERVTPEQLESQQPPPPGLPRRLASEGALQFVKEVLWREADVVSLPGDRASVALELRPYLPDPDECLAARDAGYQPPRLAQPCRFFFQLNGTRASCKHGLRCRFAHAREREDFL